MAINWRLRGTVFRLLAAVYAEMGDEAFKGRYGSFAKFYGSDATYDAIKSFFAKEIARTAEELKAQNPDHQGSGKTIPQRQASKPSRRPQHLSFDDEDISIVGEREANGLFQRPAKRPRLFESPQPSDAAVQFAQYATVHDRITTNPLRNGEIAAQSTNTQGEIVPPALQGSASHPEPTSSASNPIDLTSQTLANKRASQRQATPDQRPSSTFQGPIDNRAAQSPQTDGPPTPVPESFGYVTNEGKYRCALCFSQFTSRKALGKHESISQLHLSNLKNFFTVSKGLAKLNQVTSAQNPRPHQSTRPIFRPLTLGGFDEREGVSASGSTSHANACGNASTIHDEQQNRHQTQDDSSLDMIEVISHSQEPSPVRNDPNAHNATTIPHPGDNMEVDKGKRRASSLPATGPAAQTPAQPPPERQTNDQPRPETHPQPTSQTGIDTSAISSKMPETCSFTTHPLNSSELNKILRSAGIHMAEKCIEQHPELLAQLSGRVQREAAASAATAASVSASGTLHVGSRQAGSCASSNRNVRGEIEVYSEEGEVIVVVLD